MKTLEKNDLVTDNKNGKTYLVIRDHNRYTKERSSVEVTLFKNGKSWGTHYSKDVVNLTKIGEHEY